MDISQSTMGLRIALALAGIILLVSLPFCLAASEGGRWLGDESILHFQMIAGIVCAGFSIWFWETQE